MCDEHETIEELIAANYHPDFIIIDEDETK